MVKKGNIEANRERRNMIPHDDLSHYRWGSPQENEAKVQGFSDFESLRTRPLRGDQEGSWPFARTSRSGCQGPSVRHHLPGGNAGDDCSDYSVRAACVGGVAILAWSLVLDEA